VGSGTDKVTQCSDVKFEDATNFHTVERPANEKDVLGLPEEAIYSEDRVTFPLALQGHAPALKGHAPPALKGHGTPALQGQAPALQGHALAVEHTPDEAVAATEYAPDEVVSASKRLEPERLEPKSSERLEPVRLESKSSERLEPERLEPKSSERLDPKRSELEGLRRLSTASGLAPLRKSMRMKTQKSQGNALMAGHRRQNGAQEMAPVAHHGQNGTQEMAPSLTAGKTALRRWRRSLTAGKTVLRRWRRPLTPAVAPLRDCADRLRQPKRAHDRLNRGRPRTLQGCIEQLTEQAMERSYA